MDRRLFRLDGPAGSGKTWLAIQLARIATENGGYAMYGAYTGKAAEVLRSKGCYGAQTLHSMAYIPLGDGDSWDVERIQKELHGLQQVFKDPTPQMKALEEALVAAKNKSEQPSFGINFESTLWGARILVIDEHSMVDEQMGKDLLGFGVKILALGDQFQLPPVDGPGFFERGPPDFELTEIPHRWAEGCRSPLRRQPVARASRSLPAGEFSKPIAFPSLAWNPAQIDSGLPGGDERVVSIDDAVESNT